MAELTLEQAEHVENLIAQFMEKEGLDRSEAIKRIHLFVCKGTCSWYGDMGGPGTDFDAASQTPDQRREIEDLIDGVAREHNLTGKDLIRWFHVFRCHS